MGDTQEVTDRRVKITLCSELLPRTSTQSPRVVGLGSSVSPGIRDTTPQEARSWLFRHTQTHTSYEVKIATLPLMGAKAPNLCEPPFCSKKRSGTFFSRGRAGVNVTDWVYHLVKKETLLKTQSKLPQIPKRFSGSRIPARRHELSNIRVQSQTLTHIQRHLSRCMSELLHLQIKI